MLFSSSSPFLLLIIFSYFKFLIWIWIQRYLVRVYHHCITLSFINKKEESCFKLSNKIDKYLIPPIIIIINNKLFGVDNEIIVSNCGFLEDIRWTKKKWDFFTCINCFLYFHKFMSAHATSFIPFKLSKSINMLNKYLQFVFLSHRHKLCRKFKYLRVQINNLSSLQYFVMMKECLSRKKYMRNWQINEQCTMNNYIFYQIHLIICWSITLNSLSQVIFHSNDSSHQPHCTISELIAHLIRLKHQQLKINTSCQYPRNERKNNRFFLWLIIIKLFYLNNETKRITNLF